MKQLIVIHTDYKLLYFILKNQPVPHQGLCPLQHSQCTLVSRAQSLKQNTN